MTKQLAALGQHAPCESHKSNPSLFRAMLHAKGLAESDGSPCVTCQAPVVGLQRVAAPL